MKTLHIAVVDKVATYFKRDGEIVCGNTDYQIEFAFDSEWDAYNEKTARFIWNGQHTEVSFAGNICPAPMFTNTLAVTVGVYAGNLCTTTPAQIPCKPSILCGNTNLTEPDQHHTSVAEQAAAAASASATAAAASKTAAQAAQTEAERQAASASASASAAAQSAAHAEAVTENTYSRIDRTDKRVTNLERSVYGDLAREVVDDSVSYVKDVPAAAKPYARVDMIGGLTRKCTNLIPFPYNSGGAGYVSESNGVNISVLNDGGIAFSGTPTGYVGFVAYNGAVLTKGEQVISLQGTFSGIYAVLYLYDSNDSEIAQFSLSSTNNSVKLNMGSYPSAASMNFTIARAVNGTKVSGTVYPMLNAGTTALPYEPYFEGLRSAKVESVESVGANLLPEASIKQDHYWEVDAAGFIYQSGFIGEAFLAEGKMVLQPSTTYCISTNNTAYRFAVWFVDENNKALGRTDDWKSGNLNFTTPATPCYGLFCALYKGVYQNDIMINKGAAPLPYVPNREPVTLPIPEAVRPKHGIPNTDVYDSIEWGEDGARRSRVKCGAADMQSLTLSLLNSTTAMAVINDMDVIPAWNVSRLPSKITSMLYDGTVPQFYLFFADGAYTSVDDLRADLKGVQLVYELAEPIVTDISDILPADNYIGVEGGGTLTFVSEYGYDVPSEVTFVTKEGEA